MLSEFKRRPKEWPQVIKLVQTILNHSPSQHRGGLAPVICLTGLKADTTLLVIEARKGTTPQSLEWIRSRQLVEIDKLRVAVDEIHIHAGDSAKSRRDQARDRRKRKDGVQTAQTQEKICLIYHLSSHSNLFHFIFYSCCLSPTQQK